MNIEQLQKRLNTIQLITLQKFLVDFLRLKKYNKNIE